MDAFNHWLARIRAVSFGLGDFFVCCMTRKEIDKHLFFLLLNFGTMNLEKKNLIFFESIKTTENIDKTCFNLLHQQIEIDSMKYVIFWCHLTALERIANRWRCRKAPSIFSLDSFSSYLTAKRLNSISVTKTKSQFQIFVVLQLKIQMKRCV